MSSRCSWRARGSGRRARRASPARPRASSRTPPSRVRDGRVDLLDRREIDRARLLAGRRVPDRPAPAGRAGNARASDPVVNGFRLRRCGDRLGHRALLESDSVSLARRIGRWPSSSRDQAEGEQGRRRRPAVPDPFVVGAVGARPAPGRGSGGPLLLGLLREALPRLRRRSSSTSRSATSTRSWSRRSRSRPTGSARSRPRDGERQALRARAPDRRGDARRPEPHVLHERRRRGERERGQARALGDRAPQGDRALPLLPRRDGRRRSRSRRPAALVRRARASRRSCGCSTRTPTAAPPATRPLPGLLGRPAPRGDPHVRGAAHGRGRDPRDGHRDERDHRPARRLPAVDPRGLRPARRSC